MSLIHAWAAAAPGAALAAYEYDPGPLADDEVDIAVEHCGLCHSDLSVLDQAWGPAQFPLVPGHEIVGRVRALGAAVPGLAIGDRVGLGWKSRSCMHCSPCSAGDAHLCQQSENTILGRHGGFADRVRGHWRWVVPLPEGVESRSAGPLLCGGITVFAPLFEHVRPTDRVGIVGVGGLGHLAIQFARAWGCEVTAFTSSPDKAAQARELGAHRSVASMDEAALKREAGRHDVVLVTANVALPWARYLSALAPRGRLHFVGAVLDPVPVPVFSLLGGHKAVSASPIGSPAVMRHMLEFCARHDIRPWTEHFPAARINDALARLRSGQARYRVVVDFAD